MNSGFMSYNKIMELNYDENYWNQPCPQIECHKDKCECGLEYVPIPAALEATNQPTNGAYCNAIVKYEGSGAVYIYSKEGVPVLIKESNA